MKLKYNFHVREIAGEYILIPMGSDANVFTGMVSTNEVGAAFCEALKQEIGYEDLLDMVCREFEVERQTAQADLDAFLAQLRKLKLLEE